MNTPGVLDEGGRLQIPTTSTASGVRTEFSVYSGSVRQAEVEEDRSMSPGYYLVLLRLHQKKVRRRWCQHTFGLCL